MSALGQKQTSDDRPLMSGLLPTAIRSALPPKADMVQRDRDVRFFVPTADIQAAVGYDL
jgi:hypothetical protein